MAAPRKDTVEAVEAPLKTRQCRPTPARRVDENAGACGVLPQSNGNHWPLIEEVGTYVPAGIPRCSGSTMPEEIMAMSVAWTNAGTPVLGR
mmetsp:Transcript_64051/g.126708  ORF Transcript_64051/g.126708 Transcript_64051/m.126708 type:complete len:91 (+) Transcript_64051:272-544(+)